MRWNEMWVKARSEVTHPSTYTHKYTHHLKHACAVTSFNIYVLSEYANAHTQTLKGECVKYGLISQAVWD